MASIFFLLRGLATFFNILGLWRITNWGSARGNKSSSYATVRNWYIQVRVTKVYKLLSLTSLFVDNLNYLHNTCYRESMYKYIAFLDRKFVISFKDFHHFKSYFALQCHPPVIVSPGVACIPRILLVTPLCQWLFSLLLSKQRKIHKCARIAE